MSANSVESSDLPLSPSSLERDARWHLTARIAESSVLARSNQLREILYFIVRQHLLHPNEPLRESEIAQKVLGRSANFNPVDDNIVRVQMAHLRKRLEQYFSDQGKKEQLVLSVARGSYRPVFSPRSSYVPVEVELHAMSVPAPADEVPSRNHEEITSPPRSARFWIVAGALVLLGLCIYFAARDTEARRQIEELQNALEPWHSQPALTIFWSGFFNSPHETDLVISDNSLLLNEQIIRESTSFTAYINHNFPSDQQKRSTSPDTRLAVSIIGAKELGSISEFKLAQKLLALSPKNEHVRFFGARQFPPSFLEQNNIILIGGMISNPWEGVFDDKLNFGQVTRFIDTGSTDIENRAPQGKEPKGYRTSDNVGYCGIAYLPQATRGTNILVIEGSGSEATEAAGDFLTSEQQMSALLRLFHAQSFPPFELLLKINQLRGTPLTATVEAFRVYPSTH